jgi:hypothetical protein
MKPGDDLSYYLGPSAKRATAEQCRELRRALKEARRATIKRADEQTVGIENEKK